MPSIIGGYGTGSGSDRVLVRGTGPGATGLAGNSDYDSTQSLPFLVPYRITQRLQVCWDYLPGNCDYHLYKGENGIPRRHYFVKGDPRTHHLHMLEATSEEWKHHLLFRDYLRENPEVMRAYLELKQSLAARFTADRQAYQSGKDRFIQAVLLTAKTEGDYHHALAQYLHSGSR